MTISIHIFLLLFIYFSLCAPRIQASNNIDTIESAVKSMVDYKMSSPSQPPTAPYYPSSKSKKAAADFMMAMFERQQSAREQLPFNANIVRSVIPSLGEAPIGNDAAHTQLHFIIDKPLAGERIVGARLYLDSSNRHSPAKVTRHSPGGRNHLYARLITSPYGIERTLVDDEDDIDMWAYDATMVLNRTLKSLSDDTNATQTHVAIVMSRFGGDRAKSGRQRDLSAIKVLRRNSPFLIVYLKSLALFDGTRSETSASDDLTKPDESENPRPRQKRSSVVDTKYWLYRFGHGNEDHTITSTMSPSTNLSATTPESADMLNARAYLRQGPELFHTRQEMRRNREKNRLISKANRQYHHCVPDSSEYNGVCRKQKMDVNLADIGWQHTIIAPKSLTADYCVGECDFPLSRSSNPSNHALLQSVLRRFHMDTITRVCCAPSRLEALTLLYFDHRDNVVLKTFPKMIVKACGCL